jgi:hypothetical protein
VEAMAAAAAVAIGLDAALLLRTRCCSPLRLPAVSRTPQRVSVHATDPWEGLRAKWAGGLACS